MQTQNVTLIAVASATITLLAVSEFVDKHLKPEYKRRLAEFLSGSPPMQPFVEFERTLIHALMKLFLRDGYIKASAVMWYSIIGAAVISLIELIFTARASAAETTSTVYPIAALPVAWFVNSIHYAFISFAADFFSLFMTKKIFIDECFRHWPFVVRWLVDTLVSVGFPLVAFLGAAALYMWLFGSPPEESVPADQPLTFYKPYSYPIFVDEVSKGMLVTMLMSVLLSLYQLFLLAFGTALRSTIRVLSLGYLGAGRFLNLERSPLSFVTLFGGALIAIGCLVWRLVVGVSHP